MSKRSKRRNAEKGSVGGQPIRIQSEVSSSAKPNRREQRQEGAQSRAGSPTRNALAPRHQGRVKAYAHDVVDHQHHLVGLFWPVIVIVVLLLVVFPIQFFSLFIVALGFLATILVQGIFLGRQVTAQAKGRFPKEDITGASLGWYAVARASRMRALRVPQPRVHVGDKI